jgi:catechol 2,3-dioxygenase-like lactoylglutathione lyase family enzyme
MTALGMHHAGRTVRDLDVSLPFYRDLLGLRVDDDEVLVGRDISRFVGVDGARLRAVMLSVDGYPPFVELTQFLDPPRGRVDAGKDVSTVGSGHISLLVEDIHGEYARLSAAGVPFNGPPIAVTEGMFAGQWVAACLDPDGLMVELWCDPAAVAEQPMRKDE